MAIKKSNVACVHRRNISQYDSGERCGPWASCSKIGTNHPLLKGIPICSNEGQPSSLKRDFFNEKNTMTIF
jgi:hypothetical protein